MLLHSGSFWDRVLTGYKLGLSFNTVNLWSTCFLTIGLDFDEFYRAPGLVLLTMEVIIIENVSKQSPFPKFSYD